MMQYVLTKEEIENLVPLRELNNVNDALEVAREMISGKTAEACMKGYCDMCPVSDIGGNAGEARPTRQTSKQICKLPRRYHK